MPTFHVHVRPCGLTDGKPLDVDCNISGDASGANLKMQIVEKTGLPIDEMVLWLGHGIDHHNLSGSPITDEARLHSAIAHAVPAGRDAYRVIAQIDESGLAKELPSTSMGMRLNSGKGINR